jgi:carboxypeptidase C (cathepsin A)
MSIFQYEFLYRHAFMDRREYIFFQGSCIGQGYESKGCQDIRSRLDGQFNKTNTPKNNIYKYCTFQKIEDTGPEICWDIKGIYKFLNDANIQKKLHVKPGKFEECNARVRSMYKMSNNGSTWLYPSLIRENLRIWVYSGDVDGNVPITGTLTWLRTLREEHGIPIIEPWREWWMPGMHAHEDQMAGMAWHLRGLTFATIKGAGHLAPRDKPKEAFVLLDSFLKGEPLPYKSEN